MPFASVDLLSDDERVDKGSEPVPVRPRAKSVTSKPVVKPAELRARIVRLVGQLCFCTRHMKRSSFGRQGSLRQFRNETETLFQLNLRLRRLAKQDMDNEAGRSFFACSQVTARTNSFVKLKAPSDRQQFL